MNPIGTSCAVSHRSKVGPLPFLLVFAALLLPARAQIQYTIIDLGKGDVIDINNRGQVIGYNDGLGYYLFSNGIKTSFSTLDGGLLSACTPKAINDQGTIVGYTGNNAFMYSNGALTILPTLGYSAQASDVNNSGLIVGTSRPDSSSPYIGVTFTSSSITSLGLPFAAGSIRTSDSSQMLVRDSSGNSYLYNSGVLTPLGSSLVAMGIGNSGIITGERSGFMFLDPWGLPDFETHAMLYENGNLIDLGTINWGGLFAGSYSSALAINSSNQAVGFSTAMDQGSGVVVYMAILSNNGSLSGLDWMTDFSGTNFYTLTRAEGINDLGQIIGEGKTLSGETHTFLLSPLGLDLSPVPKPSTYGTIGALSLLGLILRRRWKRRQSAPSATQV